MAADPRLVELLSGARRILVLTGAGISTGSGIPDFRGPAGVWKTRQPVYYDDFLASEDKRIEYWDYKFEGWRLFRDAKPNATHLAVAALESLGRVEAVVTQNIDGLHQAAGSRNEGVVEIHGTNRWVQCVECGRREEPDRAMRLFEEHRCCPRCTCGGPLKSATISFGQALDPDVMRRATEHAQQSDLVLALGSTLSVQPAASIPLIAVRGGAPYIIVNRGPTDHDDIASLRLEGDVADIVPQAVAALRPSR